MGSQSLRSDPSPPPPSILFGDKQPVTALDSSSDAAARRSECDPGLTVVCQRPGLQLPSAKAARDGLDTRARPPVGGLLVSPHYVEEEMASFCFPWSRNPTLTNSRAQNDIGAELVRAGGRTAEIYSFTVGTLGMLHQLAK